MKMQVYLKSFVVKSVTIHSNIRKYMINMCPPMAVNGYVNFVERSFIVDR